MTKAEISVIRDLEAGLVLKKDRESSRYWMRKPNAHWHEFGRPVCRFLIQRMRDSGLLVLNHDDGIVRYKASDLALATIPISRIVATRTAEEAR